MSRSTEWLTENIAVHYGSDHAIGNWMDVTDKRFEQSGRDEQGEGYVMEYSTLFKFGTNYIELTEADVPFSQERIIEACDKAAKNNYAHVKTREELNQDPDTGE